MKHISYLRLDFICNKKDDVSCKHIFYKKYAQYNSVHRLVKTQ